MATFYSSAWNKKNVPPYEVYFVRAGTKITCEQRCFDNYRLPGVQMRNENWITRLRMAPKMRSYFKEATTFWCFDGIGKSGIWLFYIRTSQQVFCGVSHSLEKALEQAQFKAIYYFEMYWLRRFHPHFSNIIWSNNYWHYHRLGVLPPLLDLKYYFIYIATLLWNLKLHKRLDLIKIGYHEFREPMSGKLFRYACIEVTRRDTGDTIHTEMIGKSYYEAFGHCACAIIHSTNGIIDLIRDQTLCDWIMRDFKSLINEHINMLDSPEPGHEMWATIKTSPHLQKLFNCFL